METLLPVTGVLTAAAITPGPNNTIVMQAGARGLAHAAAPIAGVVAGSLLLLAMVWAGLAGALAASPWASVALAVCGAIYLAWLGARMVVHAGAEAERHGLLPSSLIGVAGFQLLNPKAWVLVTTAAAAMSGESGIFLLAPLMVLITSACLLLWALAGAALARSLADPRARCWLDRAMGAALILSALGIVADAIA
jgi:threonine/homoserine/homoserine lactone efflux protein